MISLKVDEAFAFDYLSILQVKFGLDKNEETKKVKRAIFDACCKNLEVELGQELFERIFESKAYAQLYVANLDTFNLVDKAKTDAVKASEVDKANYKRFLCKNALQKAFFNSETKELKIGYENANY